MPARDIFHKAVRKALEKEQWLITHDPLSLDIGGVEMYIDLGAEKILAAEKNGQKMAVEIKSFLGNSAISEFHTAVGQFINYRLALREQEPERILYLAVPADVYKSFFNLKFIQQVIEQYQIKLIIYDPVNEVIVKWQN